MKTRLLTPLAAFAQILLAFLVALPIFVLAKTVRRLQRRGAPRVTGGTATGEPLR